MIIGFIGFGEVGSTLADKLIKSGISVKTSSKGRSSKTKELIAKKGLEDLSSYEELAKTSDILISSVSPSNAITIAKDYGKYSKLFLDLNNISPKTTEEIAIILGNKFVDGAIIGRILSEKSIIYLSGPNANKIAILNNYGIKTQVISSNTGDASTLKSLRSIYTKGVSAILIETLKISEKLGLSDELIDTIAISECEDFKDHAESRIEGSIKHSKRKYEELEEIISYLKSLNNVDIDTDLMEAIKHKFKKI